MKNEPLEVKEGINGTDEANGWPLGFVVLCWTINFLPLPNLQMLLDGKNLPGEMRTIGFSGLIRFNPAKKIEEEDEQEEEEEIQASPSTYFLNNHEAKRRNLICPHSGL
jgi:hypothetical protein